MMYSSWDIKHDRQNFFCHFGLFFALLPPPNNLENENFEKMKKSPGGIIILNKSAINENHMMYDSWDMEHDRQNRFSFWTFFALYTLLLPLKTQRISFEKMKKATGDIIIVHKCTTNDKRMIYGSWDMKCPRQNFFVILGHFLTFYTPNSPKMEISKQRKEVWNIIILHNCTKNHDHRLYCSWDMAHDGYNYFSF